MIAYMHVIGIQKSKFAIILFRELDLSGLGRQIKFREKFHPVGYVFCLFLNMYNPIKC